MGWQAARGSPGGARAGRQAGALAGRVPLCRRARGRTHREAELPVAAGAGTASSTDRAADSRVRRSWENTAQHIP